MKRIPPWFAAAFVLTTACFRDQPFRLENKNLGIIAVFPGEPRLHKFSEPTPFGDMEWFSTTYEPSGRLDRSFYINVGNLPPGDKGGATESEILATMEKFLAMKIGKIETKALPASRGAGFSYSAHLPDGSYAEGVTILKRGRIHQAQATVARSGDRELRTFLDSFEVM